MSGNDAAFPGEYICEGPDRAFKVPAKGLTKRELFAAMVLQGMMANRNITENAGEICRELGDNAVATLAVELADQLIAELSKQEAAQ